MSPAVATGRQNTKLNKLNTDAFDASMGVSRLANLPGLANDDDCLQWRKSGPSRTGTCLALEASHKLAGTTASRVAPLQLVWRGDEPLDKLHIALKVICFTFNESTTWLT